MAVLSSTLNSVNKSPLYVPLCIPLVYVLSDRSKIEFRIGDGGEWRGVLYRRSCLHLLSSENQSLLDGRNTLLLLDLLLNLRDLFFVSALYNSQYRLLSFCRVGWEAHRVEYRSHIPCNQARYQARSLSRSMCGL